MLEDEHEQKYPFLLVFLHVYGLRGTLKYVSLADVRSAISLYKESHNVNQDVAEITRVGADLPS